MCECVDLPCVAAGFGCCQCHKYNGLQRLACSLCGRARCSPLQPDTATGRQFETYGEAYANDPDMLARVQNQLDEQARGRW